MNENGWHLDKRVSIGHIVTTLVVAVSVVWYIAKVEKKVDLNAQMIQIHTKQIQETGQSVTNGFADMKVDLRAMWGELRRINERLGDKADR